MDVLEVWAMNLDDVLRLSDPKDYDPPHKIAVGTEELAARARSLFPEAEVVISEGLGPWGWWAYSNRKASE